jgi:hypothetical protein
MSDRNEWGESTHNIEINPVSNKIMELRKIQLSVLKNKQFKALRSYGEIPERKNYDNSLDSLNS